MAEKPSSDTHNTTNANYLPKSSPGKRIKSSSKDVSSTGLSSSSSSSSLTSSRRFNTPVGIKNPFNAAEESRISHGKKGVYQIGHEIGRGAFGVVFQAFNVETGDFVAVKRFPIKSIDNDQLASIESEIELMQKLDHVNIVHYIATIKTKNFLYIVLEYMENGSLSNVIKKFGAFSESLSSIYVSQVLSGLNYLHEQGVLHRDIKGANILTTKDGQVKLADFGVAVRLSEGSIDGLEVVGSPYWIAPEVIEMSTPTSACDIWSVGCLIIELLTGKPPYHDLAPLAAMFHIVQDDYPPLPNGISDVVKDFLYLCFNKDPALRPSARTLMLHRWLLNSSVVSSLKESELEASVSGLESSVANTIRMYRKLSHSRTASSSRSGEKDADNRHAIEVLNQHTYHYQPGLPPSPILEEPDVKFSPSSEKSDLNKSGSPNSKVSASRENIWVASRNHSPTYAPRQKLSRLPLDSPIHGHANYFEFDGFNNSMEDMSHLVSKSSDMRFQNIQTKPITPSIQKTLPIGLSIDDDFNESNPSQTNETMKKGSPKLRLSLTLNLSDDEDQDVAAPDESLTRYRSSSDPPLSSRTIIDTNNRDTSKSDPVPVSADQTDSKSPRLSLNSSVIKTSVTLDVIDHEFQGNEIEESNRSPSFHGSPDEQLNAKKKHQSNASKPRNTSVGVRSLSKEDKQSSFKFAMSPRLRAKTARAKLGGQFFRSRSPSSMTSSRNGNDSRIRSSPATPVETPKVKIIRHDSHRNMLNMTRENSMRAAAGREDFREAKELFRVIIGMKPQTSEKNMEILCDQLIGMIENNPELSVNLISFYGFSAMFDLFETRDPISGHMIHVVRYPILKLINKLMETNIRAQEQLVIVGILPKIIRIIEIACMNEMNSSLSTSFSAASEQFTASLGMLWPSAFQPQPVTFEPIVLESARFLYLMASASNQTVQGVITAGGLQTVVDMIAMGSHIIRPNLIKLLYSIQIHSPTKRPYGNSNLARGLDAKPMPTDRENYNHSLKKSSEHPFAFIQESSESIAAFTASNGVSEDAKELTYLGIDVLIRICREPSQMKREYCRIFVKYGLLHHLAASFFNILTLYHKSFITKRPSTRTATPDSLSSSESRNISDEKSETSSLRSGSNSLTKSNAADDSIECKYAFAIANIFYNYSRFDTMTVELLSRYDPGSALWVMLLLLSAPELQIAPRIVVSSVTNNTGSTFTYLDTPTNVPVLQQLHETKLPQPMKKDIDIISFNGIAGVVGFGSMSSQTRPTAIESSSTPGPSSSYVPDPFSLLSSPTYAANSISKEYVPLSRSYMEIILLILRTLKNLSSEPTNLLNLERAGVIQTIIPLLNGPLSDKCKNQIIACIYNLCRVNKRRQEQAALLGLIPYLQYVIMKDKETKARQYALPLLCSLAHTSALARLELWRNDGVTFFLSLLRDKNWQSHAFNALVTWNSHDTENVEMVLIQPANLVRLIEFFRMATPQAFRSIHQPLLDMMLKSESICRSLGASGLFISSLLKRLNGSDAIILCSLLRIIQLLHNHHTSPRQFVLDNDLYNIVKRLTKSEDQVLVYQMATRLLIDFQMSTIT